MSWEELVDGAEYVHKSALPQMDDIVARAIAAGAKPPLEYIGTGMTAVVFCVNGVAYKVARGENFLEDEAEWLDTAKTVPWVKDHVAKIHHFDTRNFVIVRECPMPGPDMTPYRYGDGKLFDLHQEIRKRMIPHGWTAPEFKLDSYVITARGPVLVDASMPARVGKRFLRYVQDLLEGLRESDGHEWPGSVASVIRTEIIDGRLTQGEAQETLTRLAELEAAGNRWSVGTMKMNEKPAHDRPLAVRGLKSYRYRGDFGWVMIGARDNADALREAERSIDGKASLDRLQAWNGTEYVNVKHQMHDGPSIDKKRIAIDLTKSQQAEARAAIAAARHEASAARSACSLARRTAIETCAGAKSLRIKRDALVKLAHEYRMIRRAEIARTRKSPSQRPGIAKSESDDEVKGNIPPELLPTWERMKRAIKGSPHKSRTETFLEWVEAHPSEIVFVEPSDDDYERSFANRRVGEGDARTFMGEAVPGESQIIDYFIFESDDADIGLFSRADTGEVADHFRIEPVIAFRILDKLAKKKLLEKSRDVLKAPIGKKSVGYQLWEYYWKPGDLERYDEHNDLRDRNVTSEIHELNVPAGKKYEYLAKLRPITIFTVPKGFSGQRRSKDPKRFPHGVVIYDKPLSRADVESFELAPLDPHDPINLRKISNLIVHEVMMKFSEKEYYVMPTNFGTMGLTISSRPGVEYQVTYFDKKMQPTGHEEFNDFGEAALFMGVPNEVYEDIVKRAIPDA